MNTAYLYRVQIVEYPEGALKHDEHEPDWMDPDPEWQPEGWDPGRDWIEACGRGSADFFWPSTDKEWRSRSSAAKRKKLIESYGAKCIIQRTARIAWPSHGYEHVGDELVALASAMAERARSTPDGGAS